MNPFRKRSAVQQKQLPFSIQVKPGQYQERSVEPHDALPEILQGSDFRTSLILTDLSRRFSVLRSPTGDGVTVGNLKSKFAEQRERGAENHITEEEEVMLLETLGRMRSRASALPGKSQENVNELSEQHAVKSTNASISTAQSSLSSSPAGRSVKRYSNNLFGSGRLRDYTYFKSAGPSHGRTGSTRAPSLTPTETSISIQEISSLSDSLRPITPENSSVQSNVDKLANQTGSFILPSTSEEGLLEPPPTIDSSLLKRASMALADAIKELEEETEDEVVMPRLARPNAEQSSKQPEEVAALTQSLQSSLHSPTIIEAGTAISSDKQVITSYEERRASPVHSRILPGYVPGMPRPMTPRDLELDEQRSHSTTPRAMSPMPSNAVDTTSAMPTSPVIRRGSVSSSPHRPTSPINTSTRPATPSRSAPLFLQRSPNGRRTPDSSTLRGESMEHENSPSSSAMTKRRPASPLVAPTYQPMSVSSRPSTPSNIVWNIASNETNQKLPGHGRNNSWTSDAGVSDGQSLETPRPGIGHTLSPHLADSPLMEQGMDIPTTVSSVRIVRSPTPTHSSPRSPTFPTADNPPRNGSKRSSRQNAPSPFLFGQYPPLVFLPVVNSSRSSLESIGSSYHSWDGEKDRCLSIFVDTDTPYPVWHDISLEKSNMITSGSVDDDDWDPEEIIGRYAGLRKSDFVAMQEKLVSLSIAREDARERAPSIRRRRPSTSQSNYSMNGRDRIGNPAPASPTTATPEQYLKANAVLNAMADSIQYKHPDLLNTSVQRVADTEPSPNTRRNRDLAQALFGDDIEKERQQTPKPVATQVAQTTEAGPTLPFTREELETGNQFKTYPTTISPTLYPPAGNASAPKSPPTTQQEADLAREVQQKAEAATIALRKNPISHNEHRLERSVQGSISRRRISPRQISEPRLVSASTSVDTIPIRSPTSTNSNPGTSKIGSRFRKLRGTLRAKHALPIADESLGQVETGLSPTSQVITYDALKLNSSSGIMSVTESGKMKVSAVSPPASAGPGLKGFMARFRSKRNSDNALSDRRSTPRGSPSVISLAPSQADNTTFPQLPTNDGTAIPSMSQASERQSCLSLHQQEVAGSLHSNEVALRQLFDAASNLGLDQTALNALLARTPSLSRPIDRGPADRNTFEPETETPEEDQQAIDTSAQIKNSSPPSTSIPRVPTPSPDGIASKAPLRRSADRRRALVGLSENAASTIVRRTIIYPSDSKSSSTPIDLNSLTRKNSRRRRASVASVSSKSIQDRVPTPPPPKSPISKTFATELSPPVPQIPRSLLSHSENVKVSNLVPGGSIEKSSSAYDSLYEMYSEESQIAASAANDFQGQSHPPKAEANVNSDAPALELIELANGQTIWSIVNGLRDEYDESVYGGRTSFVSEYSTREGNADDVEVYVKEHRRTGSKSSASSYVSRRRLMQGKARPETKVYYSTPAHIGHLIETLSHGMDTGSFNLLSTSSHGPGHSASSSLSISPSTNDAHWTIEERLDRMLDSIASR
ncbi:hypothetical protein AX17_005127 [Amanita inopinata Kibby_2008]|nr:hypothetical protein AX17_005127 [Amanita inopinata Kibby_2008]